MSDQNTGKPYIQVYVEALRRAIIGLSPIERDVLDFMVSRADEYGVCFPGYKDIVVGVDQRFEDVIATVMSLARHGYVYFVRKDEHDAITRRQLPNVYQISLDYIAINPEHYPRALEIAKDAIQRTLLLLYDSRIERQNGIISTDRKHHPEASTEKHLQEAPTEVPPAKHQKPLEQGADAQTPNGVGDTPGPENPTEGQTEGSNSDSKKKVRRRAPHKWPKSPPVESYAEPLPGPWEAIAKRVYDVVKRIHGDADTSMQAARCLVYNYETHVENALKRLVKAQSRPGYVIQSAMGLLTTWSRQAYDKANRPPEPEDDTDDGSRYISGEYGDFIEH